MNRNKSFFIGAIITILGVMLLLKNLGIVHFYFNIFDIGFLISRFWPLLFLILPGLMMHSSFFSGKSRDAGILVPGGILLTIGVTSQLSMLFNIWHLMWPGFILSVAVGLFELYWFGTREKGLLIPVGILGGLALTFFASNSLSWLFQYPVRGFFLPAVLILVGIAIIYKNSGRGKGY